MFSFLIKSMLQSHPSWAHGDVPTVY